MKRRIIFLTTDYSFFNQPITSALKQLGFKVKVFDYYKPNLTTRLLGAVANQHLIPSAIASKQIIRLTNLALLHQARQFQPQYILAIKAETIIPSTIVKLNRLGITTINWFPDWLISWPWIKNVAPHYQLFITSCLDTHQKLISSGFKNSRYLPFAASPDLPLKKVAKTYPIVFIGQHDPRRERYFQSIKDLGLHIWGYQSWQQTSLKHLASGPTSIDQTRTILRQAKIVVNLLTGSHQFQPRAVNVRTYETLGVGTFLLVLDNPAIKRHFKPGKELITFTTPADLRRKVKYYLSHPQQREQIARAGYNRVVKDHNFNLRLKQIFDRVKQL